MKQLTEMNAYAQMGMAALLPGMQYILERMQRELDDMRVQLALMQNGADVANGAPKRGRPPRPPRVEGAVSVAGLKVGAPEYRAAHAANKRVNRLAKLGLSPSPGGSGWANMTAEERSAEMKRRQALTRSRREALAVEQEKAAKSQAISEVRRKMWAKKTKEEKAEWRAKMLAGKKRAEKERAA